MSEAQTPTTKPASLLYQEREAILTLRKAIANGRVHVLDALYKDLSKDTIYRGLIAAKAELNFNLEAVRALQQATLHLIKHTTDTPEETS